ncbi:MAG: hypothetical protein ABJZ69_16020, partial [Hyphomicrobiales bacterium]
CCLHRIIYVTQGIFKGACWGRGKGQEAWVPSRLFLAASHVRQESWRGLLRPPVGMICLHTKARPCSILIR